MTEPQQPRCKTSATTNTQQLTASEGLQFYTNFKFLGFSVRTPTCHVCWWRAWHV